MVHTEAMRAIVFAFFAMMSAIGLFMIGVQFGHDLGVFLAGCIFLVVGVAVITDQGRLGHHVGVRFGSVPGLEHLLRVRRLDPPSPTKILFFRYAVGVFLVVWAVLAITSVLMRLAS
jgi:hypothetical protein